MPEEKVQRAKRLINVFYIILHIKPYIPPLSEALFSVIPQCFFLWQMGWVPLWARRLWTLNYLWLSQLAIHRVQHSTLGLIQIWINFSVFFFWKVLKKQGAAAQMSSAFLSRVLHASNIIKNWEWRGCISEWAQALTFSSRGRWGGQQYPGGLMGSETNQLGSRRLCR